MTGVSGPTAWRLAGSDVDLDVRLTPRSSVDAVAGLEADSAGRYRLKLRVRAVPEDGAANAALIETLSRALGVPKSTLRIVSGATQRTKTVRIAAGASADVMRRLEALRGG